LQNLQREKELAREIELELDFLFFACVEMTECKIHRVVADLFRGENRPMTLPPRCKRFVSRHSAIRIGRQAPPSSAS